MKTILCFGDSNTHGTMPMPDLGFQGRHPHAARWPSVLARETGHEVINEGHPGRTTVHDDPMAGPHRNGLAVLPALLESHRPLDLVIVKLGTNDLKNCYHVSAADIAFCLERLAQTIRAQAPQAGILIVSPPPILEQGCLAEMFHGGAAKSQNLASAIAAMCARTGLPFFDAGTHIQVSPLDGIHYEAEAQIALGLALAQTLRDNLT
jgi:lysophospholipase L1-like esterase